MRKARETEIVVIQRDGAPILSTNLGLQGLSPRKRYGVDPDMIQFYREIREHLPEQRHLRWMNEQLATLRTSDLFAPPGVQHEILVDAHMKSFAHGHAHPAVTHDTSARSKTVNDR